VLSNNGFDVWLYARNENVMKDINENQQNKKYLKDALLPKINCTNDLKQIFKETEMVFLVVPSQSMRETVKMIKPYIKNIPVIHATKGFEIETSKTMTEVIKSELEPSQHKYIGVLSGPSHAEEVVRKKVTTVVVASETEEISLKTQSVLNNQYFRVYTNRDVKGLEIGGSVKNIIAIAAGILDGMELGDNAKAALLTRGLAEITRFGTFFGSDPITFLGLAGVGDLIVTGTSQHSRNWKAGYLLSQGKTMDDILEDMGMVVEGIKTTKSVYEISKKHGISMPITEELYRILFESKDVKKAIESLMNRSKTNEF
jgi:glycerol-3-phosphate dehydrogenase (NAD(P)+)